MSLHVTHMSGFGGRGPKASVVYQETRAETMGSGNDPKTFSGMAIGTAASNRVVVAALSYSGVASDFADTVTIGGVSATKVIAANNGAFVAELWAAAVPTGTTGDVVLTGFGEGGASATACGVSTYAIYDTLSATPTSSGSDTTSTFDVALGVGAAIACYVSLDDASTVTFTNITENADTHAAQAGTDVHHAAACIRLDAAATVTVTPTGGSNQAFVAASWGP
jgi:hypothetical protein